MGLFEVRMRKTAFNWSESQFLKPHRLAASVNVAKDPIDVYKIAELIVWVSTL